MRELISKIIDEIKEYAKEQKMVESEVLSLVISSLVSISTLSHIQPIIIKEKENKEQCD